MLLKGARLQARIVQFAQIALLAGMGLAPLLLSAASAVAAGPTANPGSPLDPALESASADARYAVRWVMAQGDNQGLPFVIVDKKSARMFVFEANGRLRGASPALLGLTPGDHSIPGIEQREVASLRADERTTPAGRFVSEPGRNLQGEAIVWFDYAAKLAIHRLRPAPRSERRPERLASATPDDNRISMGCVVVPVSFYETVVSPVLGKSYGVVYVLPEAQPVQHMLGALLVSRQ
ncbi:hypothetical protein [Polaromonas sp.]|uniref:hypothetical protein n=1 Tax=Polaromonas sp. TaxID=1869339 RepID=UPI002FCA0295